MEGFLNLIAGYFGSGFSLHFRYLKCSVILRFKMRKQVASLNPAIFLRPVPTAGWELPYPFEW